MRIAAWLLAFAVLLVGPAGSALAQPADVDAAVPDAIAASRQSLSGRGLTFIERHEGFVGHLYNDSAGTCTIGYGHLLHGGGVTRATVRISRLASPELERASSYGLTSGWPSAPSAPTCTSG